MALLKDGAFIDDPWTDIPDGEDIPGDTRVIVSLPRWLAERESLIGRNCPIGIRLTAEEAPDAILADLERFGVIALEFPVFKNGRAYSSARLLRERHGYTGELRAVGDVGRDQLLFMARCGFDAFALNEGLTARDWTEALGEQTVFYQATADGRQTAIKGRHPA